MGLLLSNQSPINQSSTSQLSTASIEVNNATFYEDFERFFVSRAPSVSPDGVALPEVSNYYLLSSATEIVTRQRLTEQLENLLLDSDSLSRNTETLNNLSSENQERFFHSVSFPNGIYSHYRHSNFNGLSRRSILSLTLPADNRSDAELLNTRILRFSSLKDLFVFLLLNNEICLEENLESIVAQNLNTMSDSDSSDEFVLSRGQSRYKKQLIESSEEYEKKQSKYNKSVSVSELPIMQESFKNLLYDIRLRCSWPECYTCIKKPKEKLYVSALLTAAKNYIKSVNDIEEDSDSNDGIGLTSSKLRKITNTHCKSESSMPNKSQDFFKECHYQPNVVNLLHARETGLSAINKTKRFCNYKNVENKSWNGKKVRRSSRLKKMAKAKEEMEKVQLGLDKKNFLPLNDILNWSRRSAQTSGFLSGQCAMLANRHLPNQRRLVDSLKTKTYCVSYYNNGDGLMTASQDFCIRLYKAQGSRQQYVLQRIINVPCLGWSILDVVQSPDSRHLIYSTWHEGVYQCDFNNPDYQQQLHMDSPYSRFVMFSLRFNADGTEIIAGSNDKHIYIYNREVNKRVVATRAHEDDVNAVCFGDCSSNIILSGGDDNLCKVWDRRTIDDFTNAQPVGLFTGHLEGITFIDSREDDRYFLTNSKDHTVKIWDMRHFACEKAVEVRRMHCRQQALKATLRGHSVLHTLIRARFSPEFTGKRYVYSGCARGNCFIYDLLTGKTQRVYTNHGSVVRDCAWNPQRNEIVTSSWDGKTFLWRFDQRSHNALTNGRNLGNYLNEIQEGDNWNETTSEDEDSCDENYKPIRRRKLFTGHVRRLQKAGKRQQESNFQ